jgi:hypothetical protein
MWHPERDEKFVKIFIERFRGLVKNEK